MKLLKEFFFEDSKGFSLFGIGVNLEEKEERMNELTKKDIAAIDCMARHIRALRTQCINNVKADFAEPCENCPNIDECNLDWVETMRPVLQYGTDVKVMAPMEHQS